MTLGKAILYNQPNDKRHIINEIIVTIKGTELLLKVSKCLAFNQVRSILVRVSI